MTGDLGEGDIHYTETDDWRLSNALTKMNIQAHIIYCVHYMLYITLTYAAHHHSSLSWPSCAFEDVLLWCDLLLI